jgi:hypothetical protein
LNNIFSPLQDAVRLAFLSSCAGHSASMPLLVCLTFSSLEQNKLQFSSSDFINIPIIYTPPIQSFSLQNQLYKPIMSVETLLGYCFRFGLRFLLQDCVGLVALNGVSIFNYVHLGVSVSLHWLPVHVAIEIGDLR